MNFLALVKRLRSECGIAGSGPTTVVSQTGEMERLVNWISQSWVEIQEKRVDWEFMRKSTTFNTIAGTQEYTAAGIPITDFGWWRNDSFRCYLTSSGVGSELILQQLDYSQFRDYYLLNTRRTVQARPMAITVTPTRSLMLGFIPNDIYTVSGEYYQAPVIMVADSETPSLPERFHMLIVYKAMQKYGLFESASEIITAGEKLYNEMIMRMEADQSPSLTLGAPLI